MKKIFLVGDPCIDWLIYYQSNQTPKGSRKHTKNLENNPRANVQMLPGGVFLLKNFINQTKNEDDVLITYKDIDINEISKKAPVQTIAVVKNFDDDKQEILHVDQFLGYSFQPHVDGAGKFEIDGDASEADLIIIDDAGKGIRDEENSWIKVLKGNKNEFQIIHKLNWPFTDNELCTNLYKEYSDKIIAIINADDLREHGLEISKELSWDRTIEDFLLSFPNDAALENLRKARAIVIRFNLEATILIFRNDNAEEKFEYYFFYDPSKYESQTLDESNGNMQGLTHAFIATLTKRILYPMVNSGDNDSSYLKNLYLYSAIIPSMQIALSTLKAGYSKSGNSYTMECSLNKDLIQGLKINRIDGKEGISIARITKYLDLQEPRSILKHLTLSSQDLISCVAHEYVKFNGSLVLNRMPVFKIGSFKTYDHEEIESFRSFNKLIKEYLSGPTKKPLSIAVFGPPGSGKSFGIKQVVESNYLKEKIRVIETNLSQLQSYNDLVSVFQEARDINLSGNSPLIFFDEFDANYNDKPLGWMKYFLAPMQDGLFKEGEKMHPLGKSVFVFAGGTKYSMEEFGDRVLDETSNYDTSSDIEKAIKQEKRKKRLRELKVPDFISRLKGFINIKGIDKKDNSDILYVLRRAIVLQNILEREFKNLAVTDHKMMIDPNVLEALLHIDKFEYGARSLEAIIKMSDLTNERSFKKSNLASNSLLSLHVDTIKFKQLMKDSKVFPPELLEPIAEEIHARWYEIEKVKGNPMKKETFKEWKDLDEHSKSSNRAQAIDILRKLNALGYTVKRNPNGNAIKHEFSTEEIEVMAKMEHERWNEEKFSKGWTYGKVRNDAQKIHDCLLPWEELSEEIKKYDRDAVAVIPEILEGVGYQVVRNN